MSVSQAVGFEVFAKDKASKVFDELSRRIDKAHKTTEEWKVGAVAAGAGVGAGLVEFGKQSVEAYKESEKAQTRLSDAYKRFPALADVGIERLKALAEETGRKTKFDHNAAMVAESTLAQYHLTGKQIEELLPLAADFAAKTGRDLPTASQLLGKALLGSGRALKDIGISYDKTALAAEEFGVAGKKGGTGASDLSGKLDLLHAKGIPLEFLMGSLRKQVGGFADHEAQNATARTIILSHQYDDLKEVIGKHLIPVLNAMLTVGLAVTGWMSEHSTAVKVGIGLIAAYVAISKISALMILLQTTSLKELVIQSNIYKAALIVRGAAESVWNGIVAFSTGLMDGYAAATEGLTVKQLIAARATKAYAVVQGLLDAAMDANPIGIVIIAIAALTAGVIYAYKHSDTFRHIVTDTWKAVSTGASFMWNNVLKPVFGFLANAWLTVAGVIIHGAASAFGWVPGIGPKLKSAAKLFDHFRDEVNVALGGINDRKITLSATFDGTRVVLSERSAGGGRNTHGGITKFANGGPVPLLPGATAGQDSVAAMLMPNEFVVRSDGSNLGDAIAHFGARYGLGGIVTRFPSGASMASSLGRGMDALLRGAAPGLGGSLLGLLGGTGGAGGAGGAARWAGMILSVLGMLHQSPGLLGAVERRMNLESGGNPNAINLWDSNAKAGHPSQGLMQVIPSTFAAYAGALRGLGILNPLANTYAGLNYALHRYGSIGAIDPLVRAGGYDSGGVLHPGWTMAYNGTGKPETIRTFEQEQAVGRASGSGLTVVQLCLDGKVVENWVVQNGRAVKQSLVALRQLDGGRPLGLG